MSPKVSIIIPAYNAEKYLARCLNSIAVQTMPDFECIIVDDGSIDKTGSVANSFAKRDTRFRVIHQKNAGVSMARQAGIDAATGVYTIQFDADDWVEGTILEELLSVAENTAADMVICDFYMFFLNDKIYVSQQPQSLKTEVVFGQMMQQLHGALWNKLIRRDCYVRYNIHFPSDMKVLEDKYICLSLLSHPIRVEYLPKALYYYDRTQNAQSLLNKGISSADWIKPFELIADTTDLSKSYQYFDRAISYIAYQSLYFTKDKCPNYKAVFGKHRMSIFRAKGYPFHVKVAILLRLFGIRLPLEYLKNKRAGANWYSK